MAKPKPYDLVGGIMDYEAGGLGVSGVLALFSHLIETGKAWTLQGSYGRTAQTLITMGYLDQNGKILKGE